MFLFYYNSKKKKKKTKKNKKKQHLIIKRVPYLFQGSGFLQNPVPWPEYLYLDEFWKLIISCWKATNIIGGFSNALFKKVRPDNLV